MGKAFIIGLLLILAIVGLGFGWVSYKENEELAAREAAQSQRLQELESGAAELEARTAAAETARRQAATQAAQAEEARRMAEAQAAEAEEERQLRVAELNEELQRAAEARRQAQEQSALLAQRIEELSAAREEAATRLAALEEAQQGGESISTASAEPTGLSRQLQEQEAELARLREENTALAERTQVLLNRQIEAEEAIMAHGGDISLPLQDIMSPSSRRYQAMRHRSRGVGSSDSGGM